ncbi:asparagine synthase-related protein [Sphingomonas koreensis]
MTMDRTGIYGRFNLDGAPLDPGEAALLGLRLPGPAASATGHVVDLADSGAAHVDRMDGALTLLLGRIDEPALVATRLGMAVDTPQVVLAREALRQFGGDIRQMIAGEWTLLHHAHNKVVLAASIAQRDPLLYAHKGARIAVGPDLRQLSRLDWIGSDLDDTGLLVALGRQDLRGAMAERTVLQDVCALEPGGFVTIDQAGCDAAPRAMPAPAPRWSGNFEEAMTETHALLARIVRQRMWSDRMGCMVSGGLDSSSLTWLVESNRRPGEALRCFTSAAPPGSGFADETGFAGIVAKHLGLPIEHVVSAEAPSAYRPEDAQFREWNAPRLSPRHYLYHGFAARALELETPLLFDGQYGEYTITNPFPLASTRARLRDALRHWLGGQPAQFGSIPAADPFHVFLAAGRSGALPGPVATAAAGPRARTRMPAPSELWGLIPGFEKALKAPASMALGRVRVAQPFRDPRLLTFFSGLPARLTQDPGLDRFPVRHMLKGHLPDSIRLRPKGLAFSPDYFDRLKRQAPAARARIAAFRKADIDEWLDLDLLDTSLARIAAGTESADRILKTQLTAIAAEFITWWRGAS